jgi:hypothetical protein
VLRRIIASTGLGGFFLFTVIRLTPSSATETKRHSLMHADEEALSRRFLKVRNSVRYQDTLAVIIGVSRNCPASRALVRVINRMPKTTTQLQFVVSTDSSWPELSALGTRGIVRIVSSAQNDSTFLSKTPVAAMMTKKGGIVGRTAVGVVEIVRLINSGNSTKLPAATRD